MLYDVQLLRPHFHQDPACSGRPLPDGIASKLGTEVRCLQLKRLVAIPEGRPANILVGQAPSQYDPSLCETKVSVSLQIQSRYRRKGVTAAAGKE